MANLPSTPDHTPDRGLEHMADSESHTAAIAMHAPVIEAGAPAAPDARRPQAWRRVLADDEGASTAEYAIVVMASVALAAVLVMVAQSDVVKSAIENLMIDAFSY